MKMNEILFNTFEPLWLKVYKPLRERILKGYLLPGAMLSENELAEEFQVSRTPVREAVRLLINDGLVGVSPGRKMRIISPTPKDIHEVYDIRSIIEKEAIRRLFNEKKLSSILGKMERYCDDGDDALRVAQFLHLGEPRDEARATLRRQHAGSPAALSDQQSDDR